MISIIILLLVIGALLYLLQLVPIDANIKTAIYVIVVVGAAIWVLKNLGALGLAP